MPILFNSLLRESGIELSHVRLLRHKDKRAEKGLSPYELWRDTPSQFELYQSTQAIENRPRFSGSYWASFVGTPSDATLFVGLYSAKYLGLLANDQPKPHISGEVDIAGSCDVYELIPDPRFSDLAGRLFIEWGEGKRSWIQRADKQDKVITEVLAKFEEPDFPGYLNFIESLSNIDSVPRSWKTAFRASRGIYLLTCPKTKEQYVGAAIGDDGFWGRWQDYITTGHGGNVALKSRDPSDYQVSILEVAGTATGIVEILQMEQRWKSKLQSREMRLNRN